MIGAARRPTLALEQNVHLCPRCGIQYRDTSTRWKELAPCRDCRSWWTVDELDVYRTEKGMRDKERVQGAKPKRTPEQVARARELARRRRREAREDAA